MVSGGGSDVRPRAKECGWPPETGKDKALDPLPGASLLTPHFSTHTPPESVASCLRLQGPALILEVVLAMALLRALA